MRSLFSAISLLLLLMSGVQAADKSTDRPMAIDNGGRMEFVHAVRTGTLSKEQRAALETRLQAECANPSNPITQGMIETRGPGKCMAFVRNQCACTDCEMPTYCLPPESR
jgi:hypothetical protein